MAKIGRKIFLCMYYENFTLAFMAKYPAGAAVVRLVGAALLVGAAGSDRVPCSAGVAGVAGSECGPVPAGSGAGCLQASGLSSGAGAAPGSGVNCDRLPLISWHHFDRSGLRRVRTFLLHESNLCQNSASQYLARVRSILKEARENGKDQEIPADFSKHILVKQLRSRGIHIDNDKLHELEKFDVPSGIRRDLADSMRIAKLLALISARTGARASDVIRLKPSNIRGNLLTFVPKKTKDTSGKVCVVPVGPKTISWIEQVRELTQGVDLSTELAEKAFYKRYERSLTAIMQLMPWDEDVVVFHANEEKVMPFRDCVTSHTMRHSFATNMYLDEEVGGDIFAIAQMMGHSSVDMTMSYICVPFNEKKMTKVKYFE